MCLCRASVRSSICYVFSDRAIEQAMSWATGELGYSTLRPKQKSAVEHFLRGCDVFVSLPAGAGKSMCYCLLPKAFDFLLRRTGSIVVVVNPLIALMQDQVRAMCERNIRAVYMGGADDTLEAKICAGGYQLVYSNPEAILTGSRWRDTLQSPIYSERLVGFVVTA